MKFNLSKIILTLLFLQCVRAFADPNASANGIGRTFSGDEALYVTDSTSVSWEDWIAAAKVRLSFEREALDETARKMSGINIGGDVSDRQIRKGRIVYGGLEPFGSSEPGENEAMLRALDSRLSPWRGVEPGDTILNFLASNSNSVWRVSLLVKLGQVWFHSGNFTNAMGAYWQAWSLGKGETDFQRKKIADLAGAEYAKMIARVGRFDDLQKFFDVEFANRSCSVDVALKLKDAREGLGIMKEKPGVGFRCGPLALSRILASEKKDPAPKAIMDARSPSFGFSLAQVVQLSHEVGLNFQAAKRNPGASVIVPCVVNWKLGHYSALTINRGGVYKSVDPTFVDDVYVSEKTLDRESTGYFAVPAGPLPEGWTVVSDEEAAKIFGKGATTSQDGHNCSACDNTCGASCPPGSQSGDPDVDPNMCPANGMPIAGIQPFMVSLTLFDVPLKYSPAKGPKISVGLTYRQVSPDNLGSGGWMTNWDSYLQATSYDGVSEFDTLCTWFYTYTVAERGGGEINYEMAQGGFCAGGSRTLLQSVGGYEAERKGSTLVQLSSGEFERILPNGWTEYFSGSPYADEIPLTAVIDPAGNTVQVVYVNGVLDHLIDAAGGYVQFSRDDNGLITSVQSPRADQRIQLEWNQGQLVQMQDVLGLTTSFTYGSDGVVSSMNTPYGTTSFSEGNLGTIDGAAWNFAQITDPEGNMQRVEYRSTAPGIGGEEATAPDSSKIPIDNSYQQYRNSFYWDKRAMQLGAGDYTKAKIFHWLHGSDLNYSVPYLASTKMPLESRIYNYFNGQENNLQASTSMSSYPNLVARVLDDGSTQLWQYGYNAAGSLTKTVDPLGRETDYAYNISNCVTAISQLDGSSYDPVASYTYNNSPPLNLLPDSSTDSSGKVTTYTYTSYGKLATVTSPSGLVTQYNYDGSGHLTSVVPPTTADEINYTYDSDGRVQTKSTTQEGTLTYSYDPMDRLLRVVHPDSTSEQYFYNKLDLSSFVDRLGRTTKYQYDALRHMVSEVDPNNDVTNYSWCGCGLLQGLMDPSGHSTAWSYDIESRLMAKEYADGSKTNYTYYQNTSRLKSRQDALGEITNYNYNEDDDLNSINYSGVLHTTPGVQFSYDLTYNRLTQMQDGIGTTNYLYYPVDGSTLGAGRLKVVSGPLPSSNFTYTYNQDENLSSRSINGVAETYSYDSEGRENIVGNALGNFTYTYDPNSSRLDSVQYPNGQSINYDYFSSSQEGRLEDIRNLTGTGSVISRFDYTYDPQGNILTWKQTLGSNPAERYDLSYDPADRLTSAVLKYDSSNAVITPYSYLYDRAGNRIHEQVGNQVSTATANYLNQITEINGSGPLLFQAQADKPIISATVAGRSASILANNVFQGYVSLSAGTNNISVTAEDFNGSTLSHTYQVTALGTTNSVLSYDKNGNLLNDGSMAYSWDAENRLVQIAYLGSVSTTTFAYDGYGRRIVATEMAGTSITSEGKYVWDGAYLAEERDSTGVTVRKRYFNHGQQDVSLGISRFYTKDHLGSVWEILDSSGDTLAIFSYDPWGRRTRVSGNDYPDIGFTGLKFSYKSGLVMAWHRSYDADLGRWLNRDPIGERGGKNLYAYVRDRPILKVDPLGWCDDSVSTALEGCNGDPGCIKDLLDASGLQSPDGAEPPDYNTETRQADNNPNLNYQPKPRGIPCVGLLMAYVREENPTLKNILFAVYVICAALHFGPPAP